MDYGFRSMRIDYGSQSFNLNEVNMPSLKEFDTIHAIVMECIAQNRKEETAS